MRAILPPHPPEIDQAHIYLIDQRGRLQRVPGAFASHIAACEALQLGVNDGQKLIEGGSIAVGPGEQESRDLPRLRHSDRRILRLPRVQPPP